jgi:hypothetical protein
MNESAMRPVANYTLSITDTDGTTAKQDMGGGIDVIRLCASTDMFINISNGTAPTASVSTGMFLPGGVIECLNIRGGTLDSGNLFVSGIVTAGTGTLYLSKMI